MEERMDKAKLDALRQLVCDTDLFALCSQGGMVTYCSGLLREMIDEDLKGRSLHYFVNDEDAARCIFHAQTNRETEMDARIGSKHFHCRMRPCEDKSFVLLFMPVSPEGTAFIRQSTAAMMQREIRDSIQVILGALGQMSPATEEREQMYQAMIRRQTIKMQRLCDNMMDLAQYQNGGLRLRISDLDLTALLREFAQELQHVTADAGVRIEMELPDRPYPMRGDREKILRILLNLVCNSMQAAENRPFTIYIRLSIHMDQYRLLYRDDLPGSPEDLQRIFDKYMVKDPFSSEALGGVGFGVSLVRAFAELHGGNLVVAGSGSGSPSFVIYLQNAEESRQSSALRSEMAGYQDGADLVLKELSPVLELKHYIRS